MPTFGRTVIAQTGQPVQVSYDGNCEWKAGGITLDWATIPAAAVDTVLADQNVIKAGYKGLPFGTILTKITATGKYGPYTPSAANTTLNGATLVGAIQATLTTAAGVLPGDPLLIDTAGNAETGIVASVAGNVVTFVAPLTIAHASGVAVAKTNDGRQSLVPGEVCVLNMSVLQTAPNILFPGPTDHPGVIVGGKVWRDRLQVGGSNQPTVVALTAALPRLQLVEV